MFASSPTNFQSPTGSTGWRSPAVLLMAMAAAMQLAFATWWALLNNFAVGEIGFTGREIGIQQSLREIPGFLSFAAVFLLLVLREQTVAFLALLVLGIGVAATGLLPSVLGLYLTTVVMSVGFHYFETMAQSLSLQWLPKADAPRQMGRIMAAGAIAQVIAFGLVAVAWKTLDLSFALVFAIAGGATIVVAIGLWLAFPAYREEVPQNKKLILRRRYWLYYALTFMGGARRQIFTVFAGFMMVEKFGYDVHHVSLLFLVNCIINMVFAPKIGAFIGKVGERRSLTIEYFGLIIVFTAYAFVTSPWVAALLYVIDHGFFALAIAMKTYFQKIADPADMAPTAGVAFTINHIAAVIIPAAFGLIWLVSPAAVFLIGAAMAGISLLLARMVPEHPEPGRELVWHKVQERPAPAE